MINVQSMTDNRQLVGEWIIGWMDEWIIGWMDACMDRWMDEQIDGHSSSGRRNNFYFKNMNYIKPQKCV